MKKTWRRKYKTLFPGWALWPLGVFVLLWGAVSFIQFIAPATLERALQIGSLGMENISASVGTLSQYTENKDVLISRIERLEKEARVHSIELAALAYLQEENASLRDMLGIQKTTEEVIGAVVLWPPKMAYDTVLISIDTDTVREGWLVFARGRSPIGTVERTVPGFAYVRLFSSPNRPVPVRIGREHHIAELVGLGGGAARIEVSNSLPVEVGDPIFFPYNGNTYMGSVGSVTIDPTRSTKDLGVAFSEHGFSTIWVSVVPFTEDI